MRVDRTFGFVDLSGFTSYTDTEGDQAAVELLGRFRAAVREVCSRRGVRVAKWLGDGAMFVSVTPAALIATVVELEVRVGEHSALALRAGVAGGPVILFEGDDHIGSPVNLAARLCDAAEPAEVLACVPLAECVPPWAVAVPVGELVIAGFAKPVPAVHIECVDPSRSGEDWPFEEIAG